MLGKLKQLKGSSLLKRKLAEEKIEYLVALDIGTEFVKALIAKIDGEELNVIGTGREHQGLTDMQAGAVADITAVVKNCDKALTMAESTAGVSVRTAVIGLAGELVKGTTTSVRCIRKDPSKQLDMAELEKIIALVQEKAEARAIKKLLEETGGKKIDLRLVNSALVRIDIDGYQVTNPVGFQGKEVIVQLYTAFAPMIHIGALEKIAQELDLDLLAVAAEPFAVARSVVGGDSKTALDAILMDVGGGTTDIAVVKEGGVQGTQMFGIGGRAYTHAIERDMGLTFARCEEMKLSLGTNKLPLNKQRDVEVSINKTLDVWVDGVELSLAEFSDLDNLPSNILLCGGGSSLDLLVNRISSTKWYKDLPFAKKPVVKHINPSEVVGITDKTGKIKDHTSITAMGLLRVGLDTIQVQTGSKSGSVREKIDRMLQA